MSKPTIVLLPGAWLPPAAYAEFILELDHAGFPTRVATYPSLDPINPSAADCAADTAYIIDGTISPLIERDGKDIVLLMHSYASMPGISAARGFSKPQRVRENKKGGVIGLVCFSAFLVPEGVSCAGAQGDSLPSWILLDKPTPGLNVPHNPEAIFGAGLPPTIVAKTTALLKPHASLAFFSPQTPLPWSDGSYKGRLGYIIATEDLAVPKVAQEGMIAGTGQQWIVKEVVGGHNAPFFNGSAETIAHLTEMIEEFEKA